MNFEKSIKQIFRIVENTKGLTFDDERRLSSITQMLTNLDKDIKETQRVQKR